MAKLIVAVVVGAVIVVTVILWATLRGLSAKSAQPRRDF